MKRRTFIKKTGIAAGVLAGMPASAGLLQQESYPYQLIDMHVHTTDQFGMEQIMEISKNRNVKFGIVEHPAVWAIKDDNDLRAYIDNLRKYPVYIGLQPLTPNWAGSFSSSLLDELDYILMDPQTIPLGNGRYQRIYELETYVEDTEEFMQRYMDYSLRILREEPITIFGWPLFLPVCIARDYYSLWTKERMQGIISAAKARNIAIEINDMAHTPHEEFILMAKQEGLKFTFGSDSRNENAGRLSYCKRVATKCGLTTDDFFIPRVKT